MTIDEVIENLKCDIEIDMYIHEIAPQIAEWLEELKEARKGFEENRKAGYKHGFSDGYNKAIEDVKNLITERLKKDCNMASCDDCEECCEVSALMWIDKQLNQTLGG